MKSQVVAPSTQGRPNNALFNSVVGIVPWLDYSNKPGKRAVTSVSERSANAPNIVFILLDDGMGLL